MTMTREKLELVASALCDRQLVPVPDIIAMRDMALQALPDPERAGMDARNEHAAAQSLRDSHRRFLAALGLEGDTFDERVFATIAALRSAPTGDDRLRRLRDDALGQASLGELHEAAVAAYVNVAKWINRLLAEKPSEPDVAEVARLKSVVHTAAKDLDAIRAERDALKAAGEKLREAAQAAVGIWSEADFAERPNCIRKEFRLLRAALAAPQEPAKVEPAPVTGPTMRFAPPAVSVPKDVLAWANADAYDFDASREIESHDRCQRAKASKWILNLAAAPLQPLPKPLGKEVFALDDRDTEAVVSDLVVGHNALAAYVAELRDALAAWKEQP